MIFSLPRKLLGSAVILAHLPGQRRFPYLNRERLRQLRDARFRNLLRYAVRTVPHYHRMFSELKLSVRDFRGCRDLRRLPMIEKESVRRDPAHFTSTSWRGKRSVPFATSGSTGEPLQVLLDRHSLLARIAYTAREREVIKHFTGRGVRYKELTIGYPRNSMERLWEFYDEAAMLPIRTDHLVLSVTDPIDRILREINRFQPDLIASYGSFVEFLFRKVKEEGLPVHRPRVIRYGADTLSEEGRRLLEESFGIPVIGHYGCVECFNIGFLCERRRGFHIHEDLCHIRIVDDRDEEVVPGETGQIVVSNLINYGTVLLNYKTGDLARWENTPCSCGRTFAVISNLSGRREDPIRLGDGRFLHPRAIWRILKGERRLLQYQLVQLDRERFQLRLVVSSPAAFDAIRQHVERPLKELFGKRNRLEIASSGPIRPSRSGKHRPFIVLGQKEDRQ